MNQFFGENISPLNTEMMMKIVSYFEPHTLLKIVPLINKNWYLLTKDPMFKPVQVNAAKLLCKEKYHAFLVMAQKLLSLQEAIKKPAAKRAFADVLSAILINSNEIIGIIESSQLSIEEYFLKEEGIQKIIRPYLDSIKRRLEAEIADVQQGKEPYLLYQDREEVFTVLNELYLNYCPQEKIVIAVSDNWKEKVLCIEQELLHTRFKTSFYDLLDNIKNITRKVDSGYFISKIFISYALPSMKVYEQWIYEFVIHFVEDLERAGITVYRSGGGLYLQRITSSIEKNIKDSDYVLVIGTESLKEKSDEGSGNVCSEHTLINDKRRDVNLTYDPLISLILSGSYESTFPAYFRDPKKLPAFDMPNFIQRSYLINLKELLFYLFRASKEDILLNKVWEAFIQNNKELLILVNGLPENSVKRYIQDNNIIVQEEDKYNEDEAVKMLSNHLRQKRKPVVSSSSIIKFMELHAEIKAVIDKEKSLVTALLQKLENDSKQIDSVQTYNEEEKKIDKKIIEDLISSNQQLTLWKVKNDECLIKLSNMKDEECDLLLKENLFQHFTINSKELEFLHIEYDLVLKIVSSIKYFKDSDIDNSRLHFNSAVENLSNLDATQHSVKETIIFTTITSRIKNKLDKAEALSNAHREDQKNELIGTASIGSTNYLSLVKDKQYIDKTFFIEGIIGNGTSTAERAQIVLITRPRRFGKTINQEMLYSFLSHQIDGKKNFTKEIFREKKIGKNSEFLEKHHGKYIVIKITMGDILGTNSKKEAIEKIAHLMSDVYSRYFRYLKDSCFLNDEDKIKYNTILTGEAEREAEKNLNLVQESLKLLIQWLKSYHQTMPVYLLIDEYDNPLLDSCIRSKEAKDFFSAFYRTSLKDNSALDRAILTGVSPVAQEGLFSKLNNVTVYTMFKDSRYYDCFGFTEEEVLILLSYISEEKRREVLTSLKKYYGGYNIISGESSREIFNPWSILSFINDHPQNNFKFNEINVPKYWVNRANPTTIDAALNSMKENLAEYKNIQAQVAELCRGRSIWIHLNEHLVFEAILKEKNAFWTLLYFSGYLTCLAQREEKNEKDIPHISYQVKIPNDEIIQFFSNKFFEWFGDNKKLIEDLNTLLSSNDAKVINIGLENIQMLLSFNEDAEKQLITLLNHSDKFIRVKVKQLLEKFDRNELPEVIKQYQEMLGSTEEKSTFAWSNLRELKNDKDLDTIKVLYKNLSTYDKEKKGEISKINRDHLIQIEKYYIKDTLLIILDSLEKAIHMDNDTQEHFTALLIDYYHSPHCTLKQEILDTFKSWLESPYKSNREFVNENIMKFKFISNFNAWYLETFKRTIVDESKLNISLDIIEGIFSNQLLNDAIKVEVIDFIRKLPPSHNDELNVILTLFENYKLVDRTLLEIFLNILLRKDTQVSSNLSKSIRMLLNKQNHEFISLKKMKLEEYIKNLFGKLKEEPYKEDILVALLELKDLLKWEINNSNDKTEINLRIAELVKGAKSEDFNISRHSLKLLFYLDIQQISLNDLIAMVNKLPPSLQADIQMSIKESFSEEKRNQIISKFKENIKSTVPKLVRLNAFRSLSTFGLKDNDFIASLFRSLNSEYPDEVSLAYDLLKAMPEERNKLIDWHKDILASKVENLDIERIKVYSRLLELNKNNAESDEIIKLIIDDLIRYNLNDNISSYFSELILLFNNDRFLRSSITAKFSEDNYFSQDQAKKKICVSLIILQLDLDNELFSKLHLGKIKSLLTLETSETLYDEAIQKKLKAFLFLKQNEKLLTDRNFCNDLLNMLGAQFSIKVRQFILSIFQNSIFENNKLIIRSIQRITEKSLLPNISQTLLALGETDDSIGLIDFTEIRGLLDSIDRDNLANEVNAFLKFAILKRNELNEIDAKGQLNATIIDNCLNTLLPQALKAAHNIGVMSEELQWVAHSIFIILNIILIFISLKVKFARASAEIQEDKDFLERKDIFANYENYFSIVQENDLETTLGFKKPHAIALLNSIKEFYEATDHLKNPIESAVKVFHDSCIELAQMTDEQVERKHKKNNTPMPELKILITKKVIREIIESIRKNVAKASFTNQLNRKRLYAEKHIKVKLATFLPDTFQLGAAVSDGDCFFDSIAQEVNQLIGREDCTVKTLRLLCDEYAKDPKNTWVKEAIVKDRYNFEQYLAHIQFTAGEMEAHEQNGLKLGPAIWGRPHIEGRMICEKFNVKLHVIEISEEAKDSLDQFFIMEQLVDASSSRSIEPMEKTAYSDVRILHLVISRSHFVPLINNNIPKSIASAASLPGEYYQIIKIISSYFNNSPKLFVLKEEFIKKQIEEAKLLGVGEYKLIETLKDKKLEFLRKDEDKVNIQNPFNNFNSFNIDDYLLYYIYFQINLIISIENNQLNDLPTDKEILIKVLMHEIWVTVNAYQIRQTYGDILANEDEDEREVAFTSFTQAFLQAVKAADSTEYEFRFPCGYEGHAIYLVLIKDQQTLQIRIDNHSEEEPLIVFGDFHLDAEKDMQLLSRYLIDVCKALQNGNVVARRTIYNDHQDYRLPRVERIGYQPLTKQPAPNCVVEGFWRGIWYQLWQLGATKGDEVFQWLFMQAKAFTAVLPVTPDSFTTQRRLREQMFTTLLTQDETVSLHYIINSLRDYLLAYVAAADDQDLYTPLEGYYDTFSNHPKRFKLLEDVVLPFIQNSEQETLLVLGEAGSGKTLFSEYLTQYLWQTPSLFQQPTIPLYIRLSNPKIKNLNKTLLEDTLASYGLNSEEIQLLLTNKQQAFCFIFDGVDEIIRKEQNYENFYTDNQIHHRFPNSHCIFTGRLSGFSSDNYEQLFEPTNAHGKRLTTRRAKTIMLSPFDEAAKKIYISKFIEKRPVAALGYTDAERVYQRIESIAHLNDIVGRPILLMMTMYVLPYLEAFYQQKAERYYPTEVIQKDLFHMYTHQLYTRAADKKKEQGITHVDSKSIYDCILQYSIGLARLMSDSSYPVTEISEDIIFNDHNLFEVIDANQHIITKMKQHLAKYKPYFYQEFDPSVYKNEDFYKMFKFGREGCELLRHRGLPGHFIYAFLHNDFLDYFAVLTPQSLKGRRMEIEAFMNQYSPSPVLVSSRNDKIDGAYINNAIISNDLNNNNALQLSGQLINNVTLGPAQYLSKRGLFAVSIPPIIFSKEPELNQTIPDYLSNQSRILPNNSQEFAYFLPGHGKIAATAYHTERAWLFCATEISDNVYGIQIIDLSPERVGNIISYAARTCRTSNKLVALTLSSSGRKLITISHKPFGNESEFVIWDINYHSSGVNITFSRGYKIQDEVKSVAISPDSNMVVVGGFDKFFIYQSETQNIFSIEIDDEVFVNAVNFSHDGRFLAIVTDEHNPFLSIYHTKDFTLQKRIRYKDTVELTAVCFSRDDKWIAIATTKGFISLIDTKTWQVRKIQFDRHQECYAICFSPDNNFLFFVSEGNREYIYGYAVNDHQMAYQFPSYSRKGQIAGLQCIQQDNTYEIILANDAGEIRRWLLNDALKYSAETKYKIIHFAIASLQQQLVALAKEENNDKFCLQISRLSSEHAFKQTPLAFEASCIAAHPILPLIAIAGPKYFNSKINLFDLQQCELLLQSNLIPPNQYIVSIAFNPRGDLLAFGNRFGEIHLYQLTLNQNEITGITLYASWAIEYASIWTLKFSPNGQWLAIGAGKTIGLYQIATQKLIAQERVMEGVISLDFSSASQLLIANTSPPKYDRNTVSLYSLVDDTLQLRYIFKGHHNEVRCVAFSPQNDFIVSSGKDGKLCFWRMPTVKELADFTHTSYRTDYNNCLIDTFEDDTLEYEYLQFDNNDCLIAASYDVLTRWQVAYNQTENKMNVMLLWSSDTLSFYAKGIKYDGVKNISQDNRILLSQHGGENKKDKEKLFQTIFRL